MTLDGDDYLEGVDITAEEFYRRLHAGASVSTSQPSPGRILACYQLAAGQGAEQVLSIHIGSGISGTVRSALVAAESSPVPVTVVDTGQASFAEGLCAWEAIDALVTGATVEEAAERTMAAGRQVGNTFIVQALDLLRRGGRLIAEGTGEQKGIPVLAATPEGIHRVGAASTIDEAVDVMAGQIECATTSAGSRKLRVGIGHGAAPAIARALRAKVEKMSGVGEIVDYIVGPSMGGHAGPGNAGAVFIPRPVML